MIDTQSHMKIKPMCKKSKLFLHLIYTVTLVSFAPLTVLADEAPATETSEKQEKNSGGMRSWAPTNSTKKAEKPTSTAKAVGEDELTEEELAIINDLEERLERDKQDEKQKDKKLTPEEKLWEKYNKLAKQHAEDEKAEKSKNDDDDEEASEKEDDDNDKKDKESSSENESEENTDENADEDKDSHGLKGILERYKKSQENKGGMNSRSFGDID